MCLSLSKASVPQIQVKFWIRKLPMLPDLGDSAKVHKEWTKVFVRNIVVEAIRALLTPLLLTGWRPNEHPAKMGMSETTLKWPSDWTMIGLIFKFKRLPDKKETMVNLFLVGPWPGALLLVPPPPPLAAPPSTPTFLISTWPQGNYLFWTFLTIENETPPAFHQPSGERSWSSPLDWTQTWR